MDNIYHKCIFCDEKIKIYEYNNHILMHQNIEKPINKYKCKWCNIIFDYSEMEGIENIFKHFEINHKNITDYFFNSIKKY